MINAPVIHVNGEDPEAVMLASKLAMEYRAQFAKDVFVELHCYRKWGHNELDDPTMTNPALYKMVNSRINSVPDEYLKANEGLMDTEKVAKTVAEHSAMLNEHFRQIENFSPKRQNLKRQWETMKQPGESLTQWDTGLPLDLLRYVCLISSGT